MNKLIVFTVLSIGLLGAYAHAAITATNKTNKPIKVIAQYKGGIQPVSFELQPGESLTKTDDMGKEKIRYELQVKNPETGKYEMVMSKKVKHPAANVKLEATETPTIDIETGETTEEEPPAYDLKATLS